MSEDKEVIELTSMYHEAKMVASFTPTSYFIIHGPDNSELVRVHMGTGEITYGEQYEPDEAATIFWSAISQACPMNKDPVVADLNEKISELEDELSFIKAVMNQVM